MVQKRSNFKIYSASAGSGKTFNIVRLYLWLLFQSKDLTKFKTILAITFTNKAVGEMKERIISSLKAFSDDKILTNPTPLFNSLLSELEISAEDLHLRSRIVLEQILHNYGAFDISTIDKFNHRILRIFARDMKLSPNFEVELDTDLLLQRAVDLLLDKVGQQKELTDILVQFAIEKADDDRSWDVSYDLNEMAQILIRENDFPFLKGLEDKSIHDFKNLKKLLEEKIVAAKNKVVSLANAVLKQIESHGLEPTDFSRSTLPNHFLKIKEGETDIVKLYGNQLETNLKSNSSLYTTKQTSEKVAIIDSLVPYILEVYLKIKDLLHKTYFHENVLRNIIPLTVLHFLNNTLNTLKEDENLLLISEFNELISKEIKDQPAPYIYERLGDRFQHYFIDEFQDTSGMQWENLIPLIENPLSSLTDGEPGSLMLVGDVKQAIYRWRGGKAEQLLDLLNTSNSPFAVEPQLESLDINYRSRRDIVEFNNTFFKYVSNTVFTNAKHQDLYFQSGQISNSQEPGYVRIQFADITETDRDEVFPRQCLETIIELKNEGYNYGDICVIVRKNKQGAEVAKMLSEHNIEVVSPDSLLVDNSNKVQFLNSFLRLIAQPTNNQAKIKVLEFIAENEQIEDPHRFNLKFLNLQGADFYNSLSTLGYIFEVEGIQRLPIYETVELIVSVFNLNHESDAYLVAYLDEVYKYSQKERLGIEGFLLYWELKKDRLSVQAPETQSAVTIMTIHKAKGLQFPVVLFPYANESFVNTRNNKIWLQVDPEEYAGFNHLYTSANQKLADVSIEGAQAYAEFHDQSLLDSINLLYVALTRPEDRLYIFSEQPLSSSTEITNYGSLFQNYLINEKAWDLTKDFFELGSKTTPIKTFKIEKKKDPIIISNHRMKHNLDILSKNGLLWNTSQQEAIEKGNIAHELLAEIRTINDVDLVISEAILEGLISADQQIVLRDVLHSIINHPQLKIYFSESFTILNERDILTKSGDEFRPDRIAIRGNEAIIIDYKTGSAKGWHEQQLFEYSELLEAMGFKVVKKILVYIDHEVTIKEF